jgi:hypothetical protein
VQNAFGVIPTRDQLEIPLDRQIPRLHLERGYQAGDRRPRFDLARLAIHHNFHEEILLKALRIEV